jgi:lysophospholipase L1-like esterase
MAAIHLTLSPEASSTILFEGDSLTRFAGKPTLDTWPWMRLTGSHYGYPEKVGDWIFCHRPDLNLSCRVAAVGGSVLSDVVERFSSITAIFHPAIVVMTIGFNDAAIAVPLRDFEDQADEYCRRLQDLTRGRVLYLGNAPIPLEANSGITAGCEAARPYGRIMAKVVEMYGGLAIDLGAILKNRVESLRKIWPGHTIYHDGTHFNAVGNEIAAGVVLRALGLMETPGCLDNPLPKIDHKDRV